MSTARDPRGGITQIGDKLYRYVARKYCSSFEATIPLQEQLAQQGHWLPTRLPPAFEDERFRYYEVPVLPLLIYPHEWSWRTWQRAALTTLHIQKEALKAGYWLRDATPFNLTLHEGRIVHFDQLSLESYPEDRPWPAYIEFIKGFLGPLLLMAGHDRRWGNLIRLYPQGLPLDLVYRTLPFRKRLSALVLLHLWPHLRIRGRGGRHQKAALPRRRLFALIESLEIGIDSLWPRYAPSIWEGYATRACPYPAEARQKKETIVSQWLQRHTFAWGLDIGAHTGFYTAKLAASTTKGIVALESDPAALDQLHEVLGPRYPHLYPIWASFSAPSPAIGWKERIPSLMSRLQNRFDVVLALAIIHHLRYRELISYADQVQTYADLLVPQGHLIIEFVPHTDPQIAYLHSTPTIFPDHTQTAFEEELNKYFHLLERADLTPTERTLYLVQKR